jgi:hypothetical protein
MQVKIVEFSAFSRGKGEAALEQLVNRGWKIVTASGAGSFPSYIVILQREETAIPTEELDQLDY